MKRGLVVIGSAVFAAVLFGSPSSSRAQNSQNGSRFSEQLIDGSIDEIEASPGQITFHDDDTIFLPYQGSAFINAGDKVYTFGSEPEAKDVARRISSIVGLQPNFRVIAANVPNAAAVIKDNQRLILYSPSFIEGLNRIGAGDWASISVMAHEIGHHLQGHTVQTGGSNHAVEIEADQFSGFVVRKLGGTLPQAQAAIASISSDGGSPTHPPRSARLEAIAKGWRQAQQSGGTPPIEPPASTGPQQSGPSLTCSFNNGPLRGRIVDFTGIPGASPGAVGSPCTDGRSSSGIIVAQGTSAERASSGGDQTSQMSTICEFRSGLRAGNRQDYGGQFPPLPVGTPCQDGIGSFGVVVPR